MVIRAAELQCLQAVKTTGLKIDMIMNHKLNFSLKCQGQSHYMSLIMHKHYFHNKCSS